VGRTREAIYEIFPRLAERRKNWGIQLSGGEQQMLTIGRALLCNPSIVLIDEATEGLAPKVRDDIWSTLRIIARKRVAVLVVDKNIDDLVDLARRHVVLAKGEVLFEGTSKRLRAEWEFVSRMLGVRSGLSLLRQSAETGGKSRFPLADTRISEPRLAGSTNRCCARGCGIGDAPNRSQGTFPDMSVEIEAHTCMGEADEAAS
jgi:ABC-type multidrug transport system ATPase subunit